MSTRRRPSNVIWSAEQALTELHAASGEDARIAVLHAYLGLKAARGKTRAEVRAKLLALAASVPEYADAFVRVSADLGLEEGGARLARAASTTSPHASSSWPAPPRRATSDEHALAHHHALAGFVRRGSAAAPGPAPAPAQRLPARPSTERRGTAVSPHELAVRLGPLADEHAREMQAAAALAGGYDSEDEWEAYYERYDRVGRADERERHVVRM
ncbi:hypothetical protein Q8F55_008376 [Vanrija albida]|uniref:Uncharacterized protein n=1 Tax=Vanrija albida TaxID=181172 RepID=A0ABR3PW98_9TREE